MCLQVHSTLQLVMLLLVVLVLLANNGPQVQTPWGLGGGLPCPMLAAAAPVIHFPLHEAPRGPAGHFNGDPGGLGGLWGSWQVCTYMSLHFQVHCVP